MKKKGLTLLGVIVNLSLSAQFWNTTGNSGTDASTNFIGTTDNQSLVFKINNSEKFRLTDNGRLVFYGNNYQTYSNNLYIGGGNDIPSNNQGGINWGNVSVGLGSMLQNTTGSANSAFGFNSLASALNAYGNTAIGINSMQYSQKGNENIAVGANSLNSMNPGDGNVSLGAGSMGGGKVTGNYNIGVGHSSLKYLVAGDSNIVIGRRGISMLSSGNRNIGIGDYVAYNLNSGDNNIYIGNNINATSPNVSNELNIGNWIFGTNGQISIGGKANLSCNDCSKFNLFVKNGIRTEEIKIDIGTSTGWADFVFKQGYNLPTLDYVEKYISEKGHLPEIPSEKEVLENGINLGEMNAKLLSKIEELTLYIIDLDKKNRSLEASNKELRDALNILSARFQKVEGKDKK